MGEPVSVEAVRQRAEAPDPKVDLQTGCWLWQGTIATNGYGRDGLAYAHRRYYEALVGPIPHGLQIDHLCHNEDRTCLGGVACRHRRCVNPAHLEAVTQAENLHRGPRMAEQMARTHCPQGHPYTGDNLHVRSNGARQCRACACEAVARRRGKTDYPGRGLANGRKTHCPYGHPYDEANTYTDRKGGRNCRACQRIRRAVRRAEVRHLKSEGVA